MHKTYRLSQCVLQSVQYHLNTPSVSIEPTAPCSPHPTATKNNILTPTFIHAPWLGPDLKGVRFSLDGSVCWGVLGWQAWKGVRRRWGGAAFVERGCQGRVYRWICVDAPVAGDAVLGAALTVFSWQLLLEKQINKISQLKVSCDSTPVKMEAERRTDRQSETHRHKKNNQKKTTLWHAQPRMKRITGRGCWGEDDIFGLRFKNI